MPKKQTLNYAYLAELLQQFLGRSGPSTAKEAVQHLGVSQPTFSRLTDRLENQILKAGKGKSTRYALRGIGPNEESSFPIYTINESETAQQSAILHILRPKGFYIEATTETISSRFFENLPYFLEDIRPSGFLGRLIPRIHPELHLPPDIQYWNDADCLKYLTQYGWDLIGNFIIGESAFNLFLKNSLNPPRTVRKEDREKEYPRIANDVMSLGVAGSSAAGEHPKFLAVRAPDLKPVLVKFSPPLKEAIDRRIADLLICEHIVHGILRAHGQASSQSCLLKGENRLFLEMERFDRTPKGRKGLISIRSLDLEFVGSQKSWSHTAKELLSQKKIDHPTCRNIVWLETFGHLIGNTDMHPGNISFFTQGEAPIGLAPVYDMLPMLYAPRQNQLVDVTFTPPPPQLSYASVWNEALAAARDFWTHVQSHPLISEGFKRMTAENEGKLSRLSVLGTLLPRDTTDH